AAYSVPSIERRLTLEALRDAACRAQLPDGIPIAAVVFDVDSEQAHRASDGAPGTAAVDDWWLTELPKVEALRARHPDGFVYRTRGGYRIVYRLTQPYVLREAGDDAKWTTLYTQWIAYLHRAFGIVADPACADWPRLFRLPHATRVVGGRPEERDAIGDL